MHRLRAVLAVTIVVAPAVLAAASFDCTKASTSVETMICNDKALSSLDDDLAKAYESAVLLSDHPGEIKRRQREWLRNVRERCTNETCLKAAYENRLAELATAKQVTWKTFRDPTLGIEFSYPSNRTVRIGCRGSKSCISIIGESMPSSDYLIAFEVFDGDLDAVAVERAVFEKKNDGWSARGRSAQHAVAALSGRGWQGLKSVVDCGISDRAGFHAGAGECMWVVLSNGKRSVVADTQGIVGIDQASMRSIETLLFLEGTPAAPK